MKLSPANSPSRAAPEGSICFFGFASLDVMLDYSSDTVLYSRSLFIGLQHSHYCCRRCQWLLMMALRQVHVCPFESSNVRQ
eukprot:s33_g2.t1